MTDHYLEHLATVPLFARCSSRDLAKIARLTDEIEGALRAGNVE